MLYVLALKNGSNSLTYQVTTHGLKQAAQATEVSLLTNNPANDINRIFVNVHF